MTSHNDETQRLVDGTSVNGPINPIPSNSSTRPNSQPIPANRLALDAQIQAAAEYQRKLRQRRRIYYIILITSVTMITFFILSFVAWILHSSSQQQRVQAKSILVELPAEIPAQEDGAVMKQSTLNARKHPTRTINSEKMKQLLKRSEMESDEEKDEEASKKRKKSRRPTRTRQLSFAPEKIIDYKPKFHKI